MGIMKQHEPWTKFDSTDKKEKPDYLKDWVECPVCKAHGQCIVTENAYGPGRHFKQACSNCGGMVSIGFVPPGETCVHVWGNKKEIGRNYHEYTCVKCGAKRKIDSGD